MHASVTPAAVTLLYTLYATMIRMFMAGMAHAAARARYGRAAIRDLSLLLRLRRHYVVLLRARTRNIIAR